MDIANCYKTIAYRYLLRQPAYRDWTSASRNSPKIVLRISIWLQSYLFHAAGRDAYIRKESVLISTESPAPLPRSRAIRWYSHRSRFNLDREPSASSTTQHSRPVPALLLGFNLVRVLSPS